MTELTEIKNRDLTEKEMKTIKKMNLSPRQEQEVINVWKAEDYQPAKWYAQLLTKLILLISAAILIANVVQPGNSIISGIVNIIVVISWLLILASLLVIIIYLCIGFGMGNPLSRLSMSVMDKSSILSKIITIMYVGGIALNGNRITAFMLIISIFLIWISGILVENRINERLKK